MQLIGKINKMTKYKNMGLLITILPKLVQAKVEKQIKTNQNFGVLSKKQCSN